MDVATIEGVVDRVRQKGILLIESIQNDKRRSLISSTPQRIVMIDDLKDTGQTIARETLAPITTLERQNFLNSLRK